jgi:hypothetical protein
VAVLVIDGLEVVAVDDQDRVPHRERKGFSVSQAPFECGAITKASELVAAGFPP